MTVKDRWSLFPFLWSFIIKASASGWRSWESTRVFQISLSVLSARHFTQIWHEAPVTHHYSCACSSPKNFISKKVIHVIFKGLMSLITSEKRNSDIAVHPSQVTVLLSKFTQLSLVFKGCKSVISMATTLLFLVKMNLYFSWIFWHFGEKALDSWKRLAQSFFVFFFVSIFHL